MQIRGTVPRVIQTAVVCCLVAGLAAQAQQPPPPAADEGVERPSLSLGLEYASRYVSRGVMYNRQPVLAPEVAVEWLGFGASVWGAFDLTDWNERKGEFYELDYTLSYTFSVDKLELSVGHNWFTYPATAEDAKEVFVEASWSDLFDVPLSPTLFAAYDYDHGNGFFVAPGLEYSLSVTEQLSLVLSGVLEFGDRDYTYYNVGCEVSGLVGGQVEAALDFQVLENVCISPFVAYSTIFNNAVEEAMDNDPNDHAERIWGGLRLGVEF